MKKVFVKDIKEKDNVSDLFLVSRKETGISKSGKPYLNLRIMDSTGEMEARIWEDAGVKSREFDKDDVAAVKGFAVAYQGGVQVNITDIARVPEADYSIRDFLPASSRPPEEMAAELDSIISRMGDKHLRALLTSIFKDPDVRGRFMLAPAAKSMHHPYLGGLLDHVLSICGLAGRVSEHYGSSVNKDLLIAGAILHDIGKIYELSYKRSFDYTDEGRLLGHITIGVGLIDAHMNGIPGFPRDLSVLLKHMILSHHGHLEFGSPKRPKTLEALILYFLDDLDAKVAAVRSLIGGETEGGSNWTPYQRLFERPIFKGGPITRVEYGEGDDNAEKGAKERGPSKAVEELELFKKGL